MDSDRLTNPLYPRVNACDWLSVLRCDVDLVALCLRLGGCPLKGEYFLLMRDLPVDVLIGVW